MPNPNDAFSQRDAGAEWLSALDKVRKENKKYHRYEVHYEITRHEGYTTGSTLVMWAKDMRLVANNVVESIETGDDKEVTLRITRLKN